MATRLANLNGVVGRLRSLTAASPLSTLSATDLWNEKRQIKREFK